MKLQFFLVFIICSNASIALNPFIAEYKLVVSGIPIATEIRTLNQFGSDYVYTANAKTSGLAKFLGDISIEARSLFSVNENGIDAQSYLINESKNSQLTKSYALNISSKHNMALSASALSIPDAAILKSKDGNIVDPLSLFLALSYDLKKHPQKIIFNYQVANGETIEQQQYTKISNVIVDIDNKPISAIKVKKIGSNDDIHAFFSPKYQYLPILIEKNKKGKRYSYELIGLEINKNLKNDLQVVF
jgi:hypothetical protein